MLCKPSPQLLFPAPAFLYFLYVHSGVQTTANVLVHPRHPLHVPVIAGKVVEFGRLSIVLEAGKNVDGEFVLGAVTKSRNFDLQSNYKLIYHDQ